jgi:hypothetical protein
MRQTVSVCRFGGALTLAVLVAACGGGSSSTAPSSSSASDVHNPLHYPAGTLVLKSPIIDQSAIAWITPLGNLNPPSHTLPTDHIYFYFTNPDAGGSPLTARVPFYAPGDGTVNWMLGGAGQESKIIVQQTSTYSYYVDHVILAPGIAVETVLTAGQVIGTTGFAYAVDLGVINDSITVGFVNPARYNDGEMLHADAPLRYYTEPVRSQLYARVQRLGADLDGTINYDKAGTLAGNWYSQFGNLPLSFAYDTYDPSVPLISVGVGTYQKVFGLTAGAPLPRDVTVASGRQLYQLYVTHNGPSRLTSGQPFWMLVEMTDSTHLRMEIFPTLPSDFDASAILFAR